MKRHDTQREFCSDWHYPPQTINSALKNFEKQGIIELQSIPDNQKNKLIVLTQKGKDWAENIISPLILAERRSFQGMKKEEREALLVLSKKYVDLLRSEIE